MNKSKSMHLTIFIAAALAVLVLAACGGGASSPQGGAGSGNGVKPLSGPEADGDMAIKLPNGNAPCGVFNANGFGNRAATLSDYPACSAETYKVLCLDGSAQWQPTATDVSLSPDKKQVFFTSNQEGTCALFPSK